MQAAPVLQVRLSTIFLIKIIGHYELRSLSIFQSHDIHTCLREFEQKFQKRMLCVPGKKTD